MIPLANPLILIGLAIGLAYSLIPPVAFFIGAWSCAANRRLSPKLILAAWGFGGLFAVSAIGLLSLRFLNPFGGFPIQFAWILDLVRTASLIVLVYGIRAALAEIGSQSASRKGPTDELA
jgi:hypothetical protein